MAIVVDRVIDLEIWIIVKLHQLQLLVGLPRDAATSPASLLCSASISQPDPRRMQAHVMLPRLGPPPAAAPDHMNVTSADLASHLTTGCPTTLT